MRWIDQDGAMRVLFATAELAPVAAVGGLAQAAAGLVAELRHPASGGPGIDVDVVMPDYGGIELADETTTPLAVPAWAGPAALRRGRHEVAGPLALVQAPGLVRPHPYLQATGEGWPDNAARFLAFSRAVAAVASAERPDVLHLNDWHTGAALAALDGSIPAVLSLHNLAYQGVTGGDWLTRLGPRARHYEWYGTTNPLSGAIALADAVVAVSPHYAVEILTPAGGFGLDGALRNRWDAVSGILNGIDTTVWDPATDANLVSNFSSATSAAERTAARAANRAEVRRRGGFDDDDVLLAVMVSRLTGQKGADLLLPIIPVLDQVPLRLVVLGAGEQAIADALGHAATHHADRFRFVHGYDNELAHLLFGAGDLYVMPSRFEPCGLTQMQAMRYGAVPVVTDVGGLHDTVRDADRHSDGNGFVAPHADSAALTAALFRAVRRTANPRQRAAIAARGMKRDWSWAGPAEEYRDLYARLLARM
jgi:starch synthase